MCSLKNVGMSISSSLKRSSVSTGFRLNGLSFFSTTSEGLLTGVVGGVKFVVGGLTVDEVLIGGLDGAVGVPPTVILGFSPITGSDGVGVTVLSFSMELAAPSDGFGDEYDGVTAEFEVGDT